MFSVFICQLIGETTGEIGDGGTSEPVPANISSSWGVNVAGMEVTVASGRERIGVSESGGRVVPVDIVSSLSGVIFEEDFSQVVQEAKIIQEASMKSNDFGIIKMIGR